MSTQVTHWYAWIDTRWPDDWKQGDPPLLKLRTGSMTGRLTAQTLTLADYPEMSASPPTSCRWGRKIPAASFCPTEREALERLAAEATAVRDAAADRLAVANGTLQLVQRSIEQHDGAATVEAEARR